MKTILVLWLACLGLAGAAAAPAAAARQPAPVTGGTAVVATESDPTCLNVALGPCNQLAALQAIGNTLVGAFRPTPDLTYEPVLVDRVDVKHPNANRAFSLTYHIKPEAVWSDGAPVTADDFLYTWHAYVDPANDIADRTGYTSIAAGTKVDDKTVTFTFTRPFAAWKTLFARVYPSHVLAGIPFDTVFLTEIANPVTHVPIGDGPYLLTQWLPFDHFTLQRNPLWWGDHTPYLDSVVLQRTFDVNTEIQGVESGAFDLIAPTLSAQLAELLTAPDVTVLQTLGLFQEHLQFRVTSATQPLLAQTWFRQAFAYSIDRAAITHALWGWLNPAQEPLQSDVYYAQQPDSTPDFARYVYDPAQVETIMTSHGCTRGGDGIWSCNGVRASVTLTVTAGNASRELEESLIATQARAAGIEVVAQNLPANVIFGGSGIPGGFYESAIFAWVTDPEASWTGIYGCNGGANYTGYCSQPVDDLLTAADAELNQNKRAADFNAADAALANDVPVLPLFQRPLVVAHRATLHGVIANAAALGAFWNLADWWKG